MRPSLATLGPLALSNTIVAAPRGIRTQRAAMSSVRDRIRALNAGAGRNTSSPPAGRVSQPAPAPVSARGSDGRQSLDQDPQAPKSQESPLNGGDTTPAPAEQPPSPPGLSGASAAAAAGAAAATEALPPEPLGEAAAASLPELRPKTPITHDAAARAQRAARPLRSGASLAAADLQALGLGGSGDGPEASAAAAAGGPASSPCSQSPSVQKAPAALAGTYRPPCSGDTSQYHGRTRSASPFARRAGAAADFARRSGEFAGRSGDSAAAGGCSGSTPDPAAAAAQPLAPPELLGTVSLPASVTIGTLPAPPPQYRGRVRSVAPPRVLKTAYEPAPLGNLTNSPAESGVPWVLASDSWPPQPAEADALAAAAAAVEPVAALNGALTGGATKSDGGRADAPADAFAAETGPRPAHARRSGSGGGGGSMLGARQSSAPPLQVRLQSSGIATSRVVSTVSILGNYLACLLRGMHWVTVMAPMQTIINNPSDPLSSRSLFRKHTGRTRRCQPLGVGGTHGQPHCACGHGGGAGQRPAGPRHAHLVRRSHQRCGAIPYVCLPLLNHAPPKCLGSATHLVRRPHQRHRDLLGPPAHPMLPCCCLLI